MTYKMKKFINKFIAVAIALSIITLGMVPAFAVEATQKPVLTLETAIKAATDNSEKLELKSTQISMYRSKMKLQDATNDFYDSIGQTVYDFPYDKLKLLKLQADQSRGFLIDQITNDITGKYNAILLKQLDIDKSKTNLDIETKNLETMNTKVKIGMATANQLDDKKVQITSLQNDIAAKGNSLKNNMDYFQVLTNLDLSKYTLDRSMNMNELKINGSVNQYLGNRIDEYMSYNQQIITLSQEYFKDLKDDGIKDILDANEDVIPNKNDYVEKNTNGNVTGFNYGTYALALIKYQQAVQKHLTLLNAYGTYLDSKYSVAEAQVKLNDSKNSLLNGLKESYATSLDLQNKIDVLKEQVKLSDTKLGYAKSQVSLGMITENSYQALVLKSKDLDTSLRSLINTYNTLIYTIEKPWVLGSN